MRDGAVGPAEDPVAGARHDDELAALRAENARVAAQLGVVADRLAETEETLRAIRSGEIDALVVSTTGGDRLFTLAGADHPYRVMVESMQEGAATVSRDGVIRYANHRLGRLLDAPLHRLIGASAFTFVAVEERARFERLLHDAARAGVHSEMTLRPAGGGAVAAYVAASPLHLDDTPAVCLVITDLTELHQARDSVVAANRTLERHNRRGEMLAAASAAFAEAGVEDLDVVLDVVASELVVLVGDQCIIWLVNDGADAVDAAVVNSADPAVAAAAGGVRPGSLRIDDRSLVGEVFRTGRPARAGDVAGLVDPVPSADVEFLRRFRVQTMIVVPLRVRGESRGVVTLGRFPPGVPYTADELAIAVDVADRAAMSIENARMFRDKERAEARLREVNTELARSNANLEQSNRNLRQFAHIASTVADARSLKSTLNTIAEVVVDATGAGACAIVLVDGQPPQANVAGLSGLPDDYPQAYSAAVRRGRRLPALQAYETGRPVLLTDTRAFPALDGLADQSWPRLACFPLIAHGSPVGAIKMLHAGGPHLDDVHVRFLQTVADQVVVAVNAARQSAQAAEALVVRERQRLARELHDSVSQSLFSMTLLARASRLRLQRPGREGREGAAELQEMLTDLESLSTTALAEMRALLYQLRPQTLSGRSLLVALQAQAEALQDRLGLTVEIEAATWRPLPAAVEEELFRIALEALANLVRHASATRAQITLTDQGGMSVLSVADDGVGFDVTTARPGHIGLETMAERAERIGGHLDIDSTPGQGTRVRVLIRRRAAIMPEATS